MSRKITVATTAFGNPANATSEGNLRLAHELIDAAASAGADVVCLPETFPGSDLTWDACMATAEPIPGPAFDGLADQARRRRLHVVAGLLERRGDGIYNTAVVIDRDGELVGQYDKIHPILPEMERGVVPGESVRVIETDLGRVGLAICFDIGWPAHWDELGAGGAELVFWPSAYDGGFPLQTYAWRNSYYVVSAVSSKRAHVIDKLGQVVATSSHFTRLLVQEIDLDAQVFHVDYNAAKLRDLMAHRGGDVTVRTLDEESVFTLASNRPDVSVAELARELGLESFREYHRRLERKQAAHREARAQREPAGVAADGR